MTLNLTIRKFDMKQAPDNSTVLFLGRRRSGKTTCLMDFLYHKRRIPCGITISGTEESNHAFRGILPDLFIYGEYKKEILEKVMDRQRKLISSLDKPDAPKVDPRCFVVLDDVLHDASLFKSEIIKSYHLNGRHFKILLCICVQYCLAVPPMIRSNLDYVFVMKEPLLSNKQKIHQYFCGIVPEFKSFCSILDNCTNNYECMVVDNISKSSEISDVLFWYKAKIRPQGSWRVGSESFWRHHEKRYRNPNEAEDEEPVRPQEGAIVVRKTGVKRGAKR
jgi:hypothetical protein